MSQEHENSTEFRTERTSPALPARDTAAETNPINPYQTPAYHPDDATESVAQDTPGPAFWITAAALILLAAVVTVFSYGVALPLLVAAALGTVRASAIFSRPVNPPYTRHPAVLLLVTSIVVTLLLMFSCAIAFVTVCTGGAIAAGALGSEAAIMVWMAVSGMAALAAFVFIFIRSLKWGV